MKKCGRKHVSGQIIPEDRHKKSNQNKDPICREDDHPKRSNTMNK